VAEVVRKDALKAADVNMSLFRLQQPQAIRRFSAFLITLLASEFSIGVLNIFIDNLAEVIPVDTQAYRYRQVARVLH